MNAAKLFESEKSRPVLEVDGTVIAMNETVTIEYGSSIVLKEQDGSEYSSQFVYTLNGSTPSISSGKVKTGTLYTGPLTAVDAAGFPGGSTVKFKAIGVTGLGIAGKAFSCTLRIEYTETESVEITVPKSVYCGKSVKLSGTVLPKSADPSIRWTIENGDAFPNAYVTTTGTLKTSSKDGTGTILLKAQSGDVCETAEITVQKTALADKVVLSKTSKVLYYTDGTEIQTYQLTPVIRNKAKRDITSEVSVLYTSSNKKAATVDSDGCVRAVGPGKATIRVKVNDGSGVSGTLTVNVRQKVTQISVTGQDRIVAGKSGTFKAAVRPSGAYNKKVRWSLDVPDGVSASISSAGKVTVKSANEDDTLIVRATAADGSGVMGEKEVTVSSPVRKIRFAQTKQTLFTVDLPVTEQDDTTFQLMPEITGNTNVPLVYSSSDRTVATVDNEGNVTALKKGKAVITCKASDGAGAKASVTVTVRIPASSVSISNSFSHADETGNYISAGCSIKHAFRLGKTYGTPSVKTVRWSCGVRYFDGTEYRTDRSGKYAKVGSTGTLKALSAISGLLNLYSDVTVELTATAADGTGYSDTITYTAIQKPKGLVADTASVTVLTGGETSVDVLIRTNPDYSGYSTIDSFTVRSADPGIAGAVCRVSTAMTIDGRSYFTVRIRIYGGQKTGKTTITVTSNDGSGRKCTITVKTVE